jgi:hypothetical protein
MYVQIPELPFQAQVTRLVDQQFIAQMASQSANLRLRNFSSSCGPLAQPFENFPVVSTQK